MKRLPLALSLAASMWACNGETPTSPNETFPTAPPSATFTLSGLVSEVTPNGLAPIEGVRVLEHYSQVEVKTDANGFYSFPGFRGGVRIYLVLSKEGYQNAESEMIMTIGSNTRLDFQLIRRGNYTLSGVVSEATPNGLAPVEGVHVEESYFHAQSKTDTNGFYSFTGPYGAGVSNFISFRKEGYETETRGVTIDGNTRLDVHLVRR